MHDFLKEEKIESLLELAAEARERAYVPYSGFRVGAALLSSSGKVFQGCNIENASYSPTNCAERTAMFRAVYEGERDFTAIAIISDSENYTSPCGVCRQVLSEFCSGNMPIICASKHGKYKVISLSELLPMAFCKDDM